MPERLSRASTRGQEVPKRALRSTSPCSRPGRMVTRWRSTVRITITSMGGCACVVTSLSRMTPEGHRGVADL